MFPDHPRAKWWQLYLIILLLVGLFFWEGQLETSLGVHKALQIGIIVFIYGLICLWIKVNAKVSRETDGSQYTGLITIIHFHPNSSTDKVFEDNRLLPDQASLDPQMTKN